MPEPVHVHLPHELEESHGHSGRGRMLELAAVLLLSITTLCIAWSGYQAAKWSGNEARYYGEASTARSLANQAATLGGQQRIQDLLNFNRWLEVTTEGHTKLAQLYVRRFRPEFVPAFKAWIADDPINNAKAIPSPLLEPQYKLANFTKADGLERLGDAHFAEAKDSTDHVDSYIFGTVFFAAVLFFAGISMRFEWFAIRIAVLVLSATFLAYGVVRLATLPVL